jgi:hypothetical protein
MAVSSATQCEKHLDRIVAGLPECSRRAGGEKGRHVAFTVRSKTFAYLTDDHHGDGRLALICRAPVGEQAALTASQPTHFFVPPYLGHRGWVGMWLDVPELDWVEAKELMIEAYRLAAPKRLVASLEDVAAQAVPGAKP